MSGSPSAKMNSSDVFGSRHFCKGASIVVATVEADTLSKRLAKSRANRHSTSLITILQPSRISRAGGFSIYDLSI